MLEARTDPSRSDRVREIATDILFGLTSLRQSHQQNENPRDVIRGERRMEATQDENPRSVSDPDDFAQINQVRDVETDVFPSVRIAWDPINATEITDDQEGIGIVGENQVNHLVEEVDVVLSWFPDADPNEVYSMLERYRGQDEGGIGEAGGEDWAVQAVLHDLSARSNDNIGAIDSMPDIGTY